MTSPLSATPIVQQLLSALTSSSLPHPSPTTLTPILTPPASNRLPPLPALVATTKHRLLSSNLTTPSLLAPSVPALPLETFSARHEQISLSSDTPVQVLDIQDLGTSQWDQVQELESERKGERTKGREIIRVAPAEDATDMRSSERENNAEVAPRGRGPFKLLLQDKDGKLIYGFELKRVEKIGFPPVMGLGCKIILRKGCKVARGMVLLQPEYMVVLGGKIERLERAWKEGREQRLRDIVQQRKDEDGH